MITRIAAVVELTDSRSTCDQECSSCMRWGSERRLALVTLGYQPGGVLYLCDACADRAARATASAAG